MYRNTIYTTENNRYGLIKKNILSPHSEIFSSFSLEISGMWQFFIPPPVLLHLEVYICTTCNWQNVSRVQS